MKPLHWRLSHSTFHLLNWSLERSFGGYLVQICSGWGRGRKSPGLAPPLVFQPPAPGGGGEVLLEKGGSHSGKTNGSKLTFENNYLLQSMLLMNLSLIEKYCMVFPFPSLQFLGFVGPNKKLPSVRSQSIKS